MKTGEQLDKIRRRIDAIDERIQQLIAERATCALEVARIKSAAGEATTFYRPEREAQILRRVKAGDNGPLSSEEMARLFREIMSACLALEQPLKIAFLGPEGTFTQAAALKHFGHSVQTLPVTTIEEVFREVESGNVDYGVVPVENSTEGVVTHTLDMFVASPLKICGEVALRIHQHLIGNTDIDSVRRVYSHQQSLAQCREWLNAHMNGVEFVSVSSNAEAARRASLEQGTAAIAGDTAAQIYSLDILVPNIEDEPDNTTRFLVVGTRETAPSGVDKTSLLLSAHNKPGALCALLQPFSRHSISMTRVESRPSRRGAWDYVFFVDIDGHVQDSRVTQALTELESAASMLKILGAYPKAVL